jgi:hypothetical protein
MAKKETKFAATSAAENPDAAATASTNAPSPAMLALFKPAAEVEELYGKMERRNMPAMFKPGDVPVGGAVVGEIIKFLASPVSTIKGNLVWLRHNSGQEFTFPVTGVIRNALAPGVKDDDEKLMETLDKEIGKILICKRLPDKSSKYAKSMFMFDVFTVDKPKK